MKSLFIFGLLALSPFVASATCIEVDNNYEAATPSEGCLPGYAPLNQQTINQEQQDTNDLNSLATQGQSNEQNTIDQTTADQIAAGMQQVKPMCDLVENHPAEAALKLVAEGKPVSSLSLLQQKCHQMEAIATQAAQLEQQEGITPDVSQANPGN